MNLNDCYGEIAGFRTDELVVCSAGSASRTWYHVTADRTSFYLQSSMGISSMFSLGLALSLPQAKIWNFDGDGALCMNPGALLTEAEVLPRNMVHFVLANRVYGATGNHPYPNSSEVDFVGMAKACGIERAYSFSDIEALKKGLKDILSADQFAFVVLELETGGSSRGKIPLDGPELKYTFSRNVERKFDVAVLGEGGY